MSAPLWLIPVIPLAGFIVNALLGTRLGKRFVSVVGVGAAGLATIAAYTRVIPFLSGDGAPVLETYGSWISVGDLSLDFSFRLDPLSALMLAFVTFVGFLIHVYSTGYMHHEATDAGYARFFAYLNLFMFAMLLLVLAESFVLMFVGWEGVGLCSYLLVGFYFERATPPRPDARLSSSTGSATSASFSGCSGSSRPSAHSTTPKYSAQAAADPAKFAPGPRDHLPLPLRRRHGQERAVPALRLAPGRDGRPDPGLGPDPRRHDGHRRRVHGGALQRPLPPRSGGHAVRRRDRRLTASSRRIIAVAQNDMKKVLAYSTVSQLGYMFLACGVGAFTAGMFHVMTHAFFKACLFLGAGSVIHAMSGDQTSGTWEA